MLSESILSGLLNASIMGAAMSFAILALIPYSIPVIEKRLEEWGRIANRVKKAMLSTKNIFRELVIESIDTVYDQYKENKLKTYLGKITLVGSFILTSFIFYCISSIVIVWQIVGLPFGYVLVSISPILFMLATLSLLCGGLLVSLIYFKEFTITGQAEIEAKRFMEKSRKELEKRVQKIKTKH